MNLSFVATDFPIRISYTGSMSDAQNNPEFEGYATFIGEYRNRDYRFVGCTFLPDRVSYSSRTEDGRQRTDAINRILLLCFRRTMIIMILLIPYIAVLVQCSIPQSEIIVQWGGYSSRKYLIEGANRPDNTESADFPLIRLAEVHCIYAEATVN